MSKPVSEMTRDELRVEAKALSIAGRGKMSADDLRAAVQAERDYIAEVAVAAKLGTATERKLPARLRVRTRKLVSRPISNERRIRNYLNQNGSQRFTPKQRRRANKKARANYGRTHA